MNASGPRGEFSLRAGRFIFGLINVEEVAGRHGALGNAVPVAVVVHLGNGNHAAGDAFNVGDVSVVAGAGPGDSAGDGHGADLEAGSLGVVVPLGGVTPVGGYVATAGNVPGAVAEGVAVAGVLELRERGREGGGAEDTAGSG